MSTGDNGALIAIGVLIAALQKGFKGGALAENQLSVAISIFGYHLWLVKKTIPSADCGIFHRGLSEYDKFTVLGWLNECGILCSIHDQQPPECIPNPASLSCAEPRHLAEAEEQMGRWAHATFGMITSVTPAKREAAASTPTTLGDARGSATPCDSLNNQPDDGEHTSVNVGEYTGVDDSLKASADAYLNELTLNNANPYMICKHKEGIKQLTRRELIDLVEGLWKHALDKCESTSDSDKRPSDSDKHPIDVWGRRLVKDLCAWDGSAQKPTSEPDLVWRANRRALSPLIDSIRILQNTETSTCASTCASTSASISTSTEKPKDHSFKRILLRCIVPSEKLAANAGLDDDQNRRLVSAVEQCDTANFASDLLRHYTAYKAAKHTLTTLDLAAAKSDPADAAKSESKRHFIVAGYSRDSLSNLLNSLAVRDTLNDLKSAHAEHNGDAGPFSIKKTYKWYHGALKSLIEITIAVVLTVVLGMGPLVAMSTSRLLLVRAGFFPKSAPCADHFIEEAEVYSVGSGRDEWWALIKIRPTWSICLQMILLSAIELFVVIGVWFLPMKKHPTIGYTYVCQTADFKFWLPQAIGGVIAFFTVFVGCAMIAPKWVRAKLKDFYYFEEKHSLAVKVSSDPEPCQSTNTAFSDLLSRTLAKFLRPTRSKETPATPATQNDLEAQPFLDVYSRSIQKDYEYWSIYEIIYCIICWIIAGIIVYFAFFTTYKFYQNVYEFSALALWAFGEAMNPHMRGGRNIVTHELMAYIMVFVSLLVGASCDLDSQNASLSL